MNLEVFDFEFESELKVVTQVSKVLKSDASEKCVSVCVSMHLSADVKRYTFV